MEDASRSAGRAPTRGPGSRYCEDSLNLGRYLANRYAQRLADVAAVASVGSKGDSFDNALPESFHGLFKTECIHRDEPWKGLADVEVATCGHLDWFTNNRWHTAGAHRPPAEVRGRPYARYERSGGAGALRPE